MKVTKAIITAMKEEADIIIQKYDLKEEKKEKLPINLKLFKWERVWDDWDEEIVLLLCWIWKIQASLWAIYLFENYDIFKLINIWIAWNISNLDVQIWDVFMPNTFIQHDMYLPFDWPHLDYAKKPIFLDYAVWDNYDLNKFWLILSWVCLTWDQFVDDIDKQAELREKYSWDIVEMEAFAILSVARAYSKLDSCIVIKAVSDWADNDSKYAHMDNLEFAMQNSLAVLDIVL